jgi:hypothetical protein
LIVCFLQLVESRHPVEPSKEIGACKEAGKARPRHLPSIELTLGGEAKIPTVHELDFGK